MLHIDNNVQTISETLACYSSTLQFVDLPAEVISHARWAILDTMGVALGGIGSKEGKALLAALKDFGSGSQATIWGTAARATAPIAALVNGTAAHVLELDDIGNGHKGSVVVPASLAVAEAQGADGRQVLTAVVAGYEVAARILHGIGGYIVHNGQGWHSTGTVGSFGAAAAASYLLGLNARETASALGIAGSFTGGIWAFIADGAMTKRLHPGKSAENGIVAAYLARQGFSGPRAILEADWGGFFNTYNPGQGDPALTLSGLGKEFHILRCGFKRHACCAGIHSALDALSLLMDQHGLTKNEIDHIQVLSSPYLLRQLGKKDIQTTCDAQLSLPYSLAAALVSGGCTGPEQFTQERINDSEIRAWMRRITMAPDERIEPDGPHVVKISLQNGMVVEGRVPVFKGRAQNPLTQEEIEDKFNALAGRVFSKDTVKQVCDLILGLERLNHIDELTRYLVLDGNIL